MLNQRGNYKLELHKLSRCTSRLNFRRIAVENRIDLNFSKMMVAVRNSSDKKLKNPIFNVCKSKSDELSDVVK